MSEKLTRLRDSFTESYLKELPDKKDRELLANDPTFKKAVQEIPELMSRYGSIDQKVFDLVTHINTLFNREVIVLGESWDIFRDKPLRKPSDELPMITETALEYMVLDGDITYEQAKKQFTIVDPNNYMYHGRNDQGGF